MTVVIVCMLAGYLFGSIPWGKLLCLRAGVDIQKRGSGNIGFANVLRIMGWKYAVPTLICDIAKAALPVSVIVALTHSLPFGFLIGCMAILGHVAPVWLHFRGGKGIATGLGMMIVLSPIAAGLGVLVYIFASLTKFPSAVASLAGVIVLALTYGVLHGSYWWMSVCLVLIAGYTLRENVLGKVPDHG